MREQRSAALEGGEVKSPHRDEAERSEAVKNLHPALRMAQAKVTAGAAVSAAIGDAPRKAYGHEGLMSGVCSGEKIPGYLAKIIADKPSKHRFALALLEDDSDVIVTTLVRIRRKRRA